MKFQRTFIAVAAIAAASGAGPSAAFAANARAPYSNIDPRVDAGNDTGNSQVERLNEAQLGGAAQPRYQQNYARPYQQGRYPGYAQIPPGNYAAQAYAPPQHSPYYPPSYAPPPGYQQAPYGGAPYPGAYPQY